MRRVAPFSSAVTKLIQARARLATTDAEAFDRLCQFTMEEERGLNSLQRRGQVLLYDRDHVRRTSFETLVAELLRLAGRI